MELVRLLKFEDSVLQGIDACQGPAVKLKHLTDRNGVFFGIKVACVGKEEPERIADTAVAVYNARDDGGPDSEFARVVGACHPQTADFSTVLVADFLRAHGIAAALAHLFAVFVHKEPVGE